MVVRIRDESAVHVVPGARVLAAHARSARRRALPLSRQDATTKTLPIAALPVRPHQKDLLLVLALYGFACPRLLSRPCSLSRRLNVTVIQRRRKGKIIMRDRPEPPILFLARFPRLQRGASLARPEHR